jgi:hypothetical protein
MNDKRLHVHSVPLVLFAVVVTVIAIVSVNTWRLAPISQALVQPSLRLESTDHGYVKVTTNKRLPEEKAGVSVDVSLREESVMRASQAFDSVGLHMALDRAVK